MPQHTFHPLPSFITKCCPQLLKGLEFGAIRQCIRKNYFQCKIAGENEVTSKPNGREPTPSKLVKDFVSVVVNISEVDGIKAPMLVLFDVFYIDKLEWFVSSWGNGSRDVEEYSVDYEGEE
jgi:hypothetical protein